MNNRFDRFDRFLSHLGEDIYHFFLLLGHGLEAGYELITVEIPRMVVQYVRHWNRKLRRP